MNDRGVDLQDPNHPLARYTYIPTGRQSLSPGHQFDLSPSNIPSTASMAGIDISRYTTGQNAGYDRLGIEGLGDISPGAFYDGKNSGSVNGMNLYANKDSGMHALAFHNAVGSLYGNPSHFSHAGDNFATGGMPSRSDLFMSQLGSTARVPSASLYGSNPENCSSHRSMESTGTGVLHSPIERTQTPFSKSVPAYIPLGNESNYVYFNPPSLSSLGRSELSYPADVHSSFSSLMGYSTNYGSGNSMSESHSRFFTAAVPARKERNKQSSIVDNVSAEQHDSMLSHKLGSHTWDRSGGPGSRREAVAMESQFHHAKTTSPKNEPDLVSWENNAFKEVKSSPFKCESNVIAQAEFPNLPERRYPEHEVSSRYSHVQGISSHTKDEKSSPFVSARCTDQSTGTLAVNPDLHTANLESTDNQINHFPIYSSASTSQRICRPAEVRNSQASPRKSTPYTFAVSPNLYSDSSDDAKSIEQEHISSSQKGETTLKNAGTNTQTPQVSVFNFKSNQRRFIERGLDVHSAVLSDFPQGSGIGPCRKKGFAGNMMSIKQEKQVSESPGSRTKSVQHAALLNQNNLSGHKVIIGYQRFTTTLAEDSHEGDGRENPRIRLIIKKERTSNVSKKMEKSVQKSRAKVTKSSASGRKKGSGGKVANRTCSICQKVFTRADSLTCHMRVHTGDRPYQCQLCHANYKIAGHLRDHVRSKHSNSRPYVCSKCGKGFAYPTARRRHEKVCGLDLSERIEFQCATCDKGFVTAKGFSKHQKSCGKGRYGIAAIKDEDLPYKCSTCQKSFATFPGLDRHQRFICGRIPQKGDYACEECGKTFQKQNRYITHTRRHTGEKPYKCSRCDMSFYDQSTLTRHTDRHDGNKRYKCSLCEAAFYRKQSLSVHIMRLHCGMKPFKCNECGLELSSGYKLSQHIRNIHRQERKFRCTLCSKGFFECGQWKRHMLQHTHKSVPRVIIRGRTVKQHTCNVCSKSFLWRDLCGHITKEHPGISLSDALSKKLLKCDICSKELSCQRSLLMHKLRHSGLKRFKCKDCDMQFVFKSALDLHSRRHTDYRPICCQKCGKTFRWTASLSRHMITHHSRKTQEADMRTQLFTCNECGKQFKREIFLGLHLKRHGKGIYFICTEPYCGRGFVDMCRFKLHLSMHNIHNVDVAKQFICQICGAGFYEQCLLDKHQQLRHTHMSRATWLCDECGKSFNRKDCLLKHTARHAKYPRRKIPKGRPKGTGKSVQQNTTDYVEPVQNESWDQQTEVKNASHIEQKMEDRWYAAPTTTSQSYRGELAEMTSHSTLPNFSMFEDQNYQSRFSTFIHQTLAWPRPEEQ